MRILSRGLRHISTRRKQLTYEWQGRHAPSYASERGGDGGELETHIQTEEMKYACLDVPIFNKTVHFYCSDDVDVCCVRTACEFIDKKFDAGMTVCKDGEVYVFIFKEHENASTVAHECLHAANYILGLCGMEANENNDETQAYLMGWLIDQWYEMG